MKDFIWSDWLSVGMILAYVLMVLYGIVETYKTDKIRDAAIKANDGKYVKVERWSLFRKR